MNIRSVYDGERRPVRFKSVHDSATQQHFKAECDINNIMSRYQRTGILIDPLSVNTNRIGEFGDFSNIPDMITAQNKLIEAKEMFMQLPSSLRKRFGNDPVEFVDYCTKATYAELVELGIAPQLYADKDGKEYFFRDGQPVYTGREVTKNEPVVSE